MRVDCQHNVPRGIIWLAFLLSLILSACETTAPDSESGDGERIEITAASTPFYRLGPQQDSGADMQLEKGTRLTLVKRSFGFSSVKLDNGWTGWIATSDFGPASPEPEINTTMFPDDNLQGNSAIVGRFSSTDQSMGNFEPADLPEPDLAFPETPLLNTGVPPADIPEFRY